MSAVALAPPLHAALVLLTRDEDPPRRGRTVGSPPAVARLEARIPLVCTWVRPEDGATTGLHLGWSTHDYSLVDGECDVPPGVAARIVARDDCPPGLVTALAVLLTLPDQEASAILDARREP